VAVVVQHRAARVGYANNLAIAFQIPLKVTLIGGNRT